jgi:hypothetical protein
MTDGRRAWDPREHEPARLIELSQEHEFIDDRLTPRPGQKAVSIAKNWTKAEAVLSSSANSRLELWNCFRPGVMTMEVKAGPPL